MKKNYFTNKKGFVATDSLIAILIITLLTGIIMTLSYNVYLASSMIQRNSKAIEYIIKIFEEVDTVYYDEVTSGNLETFKTSLNIPNGYTTNVEVLEPEEGKLDLVKTVIVNVEYKLGKSLKTIEMSKLKKREVLITPNAPDLTLLNITEENEASWLPIKQIDDITWEVTTKQDTTWYNYKNGNWAVILYCNEPYVGEFNIGDQITNEQISEIGVAYIWIPRYSYYISGTSTDIEFLYSTTDKTVIKEDDKYSKLLEISGYTLPAKFTVNDEELKGTWLTEDDIINASNDEDIDEVYTTINESKYTRNNIF